MDAFVDRHPRLSAVRGRLATILPRGAILLSVLTFVAYLMGLVRDRAFARTFGAGGDLDAYNAALVLPELLLAILVVAGLSSAFVPVYSKVDHDDPASTQDFARTVLTASVLIMAATVGVLLVIAPWTVSFVAPGFDEAQQAQYSELFRVTCVTAIIFAASFALGEMLVVRQRFLAYGLAPVLYNAGIVFGAIVLSPSMGIMGAAVGTVLGASLHLGVRVLEIVRTDFRYRPLLGLRSNGFREYVRLSIPKALAAPVEPLTFLFFTSIASTLVVGGISAVSFARNFQSVPVSLVGIAFAVAAFPVMARAVSDGDGARFRRLVAVNLVTITLLTSLAAVGLIVVGGLAIDLFLGGEAFDAEDVALTTQLLGVFALAVPFEAASHLLARAVYSTRNTILPVAASLIGLGVTVGTVLLLSPELGIVALPLGFVTGQATEVVLLLGAFAIRSR
ncbi:MAG: lipid II flippase MurJ, partial [Candidatus Limnocylindrales bacterium]